MYVHVWTDNEIRVITFAYLEIFHVFIAYFTVSTARFDYLSGVFCWFPIKHLAVHARFCLFTLNLRLSTIFVSNSALLIVDCCYVYVVNNCDENSYLKNDVCGPAQRQIVWPSKVIVSSLFSIWFVHIYVRYDFAYAINNLINLLSFFVLFFNFFLPVIIRFPVIV